MKDLKLYIVFALLTLCSCSPKSFCFFNVREKTFYISDKVNDSIKSISISSGDPAVIFKKNVIISPIAKTCLVDEKSILNRDAYFLITTNSQVWYSLRLKADDWTKDKVIKCRYFVR